MGGEEIKKEMETRYLSCSRDTPKDSVLSKKREGLLYVCMEGEVFVAGGRISFLHFVVDNSHF